jgi:hypothetical protein
MVIVVAIQLNISCEVIFERGNIFWKPGTQAIYKGIKHMRNQVFPSKRKNNI